MSEKTPTIEDYRGLVAFADTGSVTAGAKFLGVKQPVLTRRLNLFKGRDPLLVTRGNRMDLTDKGLAVLPLIRQLVQQFDEITDFVSSRRSQPRVLRIAIGASASQLFLPRAIKQLTGQKRFQGIEVQTQIIRGSERITGVAEGRFDLAILSHDPLQINLSNKLLVIRELARQTMCVVAHKDSDEAQQLRRILRGQAVPVHLLARWTMVGLDDQSGLRRQLERAFVSRNDALNFGSQAGGWLGMKEFARQGLGVGLVPLTLLSETDLEDLEIRRLDPGIGVTYQLIHRKKPADEIVETMKTYLLDSAKQLNKEVERRWDRKI